MKIDTKHISRLSEKIGRKDETQRHVIVMYNIQAEEENDSPSSRFMYYIGYLLNEEHFFLDDELSSVFIVVLASSSFSYRCVSLLVWADDIVGKPLDFRFSKMWARVELFSIALCSLSFSVSARLCCTALCHCIRVINGNNNLRGMDHFCAKRQNGRGYTEYGHEFRKESERKKIGKKSMKENGQHWLNLTSYF